MDKKLKIVSECFGQSNVHAAIVVDEYVRKLGLSNHWRKLVLNQICMKLLQIINA